MPRYSFKVPLSVETVEFDLKNDDEAWSQAVTYIGELLKDVDGNLPERTQWQLSVCEGARTVAEIDVSARKC
jgi:hypothetical protein